MGFSDFLGGSNKDAMKEQMKANERTQAFIREQAALARGDAGNLYPAGDYARNTGINSAMSLMGNAMPTQMGLYQDGNVAAQMQLLAGMPQYQNAILGMPVNNQAMQPTRLSMPDSSFYQQKLPDFGQVSSGTAAPAGSMQWQRPPEQPVQQQQMNPQQAMQMANTYNQVAPMFGGQPLWGGATGSGGAGGSMFGSAAGSGGGSAAGGGMGSTMAAAGPWAALAAAIAANESYQNKSGNRPNNNKDYMGELATGKVLERDAERYLGKWGGKAAGAMTPHGQYNMTEDAVKKIGGLLGGLF